MRIELPLSVKRPGDGGACHPAADNDDDPFDPPPAVTLRRARLPDQATIAAYAAAQEALRQAA
jgi:hypothetical protein